MNTDIDSSTNKSKTTMVIFGGTGDLTHRKLIPAIYQLHINGFLPEDFTAISIGRRDKTTEEYREDLLSSIKRFSSRNFEEESYESFSKKITYYRLNFEDQSDYEDLRRELESRDKEGVRDSYMFYLAVSPSYFSEIVLNLKASGIREKDSLWQRLVIEKPFGQDLESAIRLNDSISSVFDEKDIYRIDHYVAKEMIQNINMLRFQNAIFGSIWNKDHISNVQITVLEKEGVGTRGGYYDGTGALRDMVQNHLLQLLAITAMEPPVSLDTDDVRNEKVKVFSSLKPFTGEHLDEKLILGQYKGYQDEEKVDPDSGTETLVATKVYIENERWEGVPFYLLTGKGLMNKTAQITIEFKQSNRYNYGKESEPNILEIKIQPDEGITLHLNIKEPGVVDKIAMVEMDYCQSCLYLFNSPDSYEKLLLDALNGDSTLFTRWDELQLTWKYVDSILENVNESRKSMLKSYEVGSNGPEDLSSFIDSGANHWWYLNREY
jgi:glucose-6-phosphate 1-dehydrogenase